jgi:hypothetical protein
MLRIGTAAVCRCLAAVLILAAVGCAKPVSIKDIIDNPRAYADRTVTIEGEVVSMLSLVVVKYFTVNDGTGSINVVTERPLPKKGERIRVTGKINEMFSLGTETLLVLVEEKGGAESQRSGEPAKVR